MADSAGQRLGSCLWLWSRLLKVQTIHLSHEGSNIDSPVENRRRRIDILPDLDFGKLLAVISRYNMDPTGFIAKHNAVVGDRGRAPDRSARLVAPDELALVRAQAMKVAVAGTDINFVFIENRTGPDADVFAAAAVVTSLGRVLPGRFAVGLIIRAYDAIFRGGVNQPVGHRRRRI